MQMRTCSECGETKPATEEFFYKARAGLATNTKTYLRGICRSCRIQKSKESYYKKRYGHLPGGENAKELRENTVACQICGSTANLCVDHSHSKQYVRGVICHNCNVGLGHFKDDPALLESAIEYVITSDSHHDKRDKQ
jgi:5-methylcytosine-specific restriction endonuclease McrA